MIFWILAGMLIILFTILAMGWYISAPGYQGPESPHFNGKTFLNKGGAESKGLLSVFKWIIGRDQGPWAKKYDVEIGPKPTAFSGEDLLVTFVNHSTFLIQWHELNILTDPIWSERCSPFSFVGPQRMRPPGIHYADLPNIDMVLLSHNHYDHLDLPTLSKLEADFSPLFIVPLGVGALLTKKGIKNIVELDWWAEIKNGINIKALPAQHFSGRGMFDRNKTLWSGYLLEHSGKKIYFAGDTGYGEIFREIGKKEGPFDLAIIPIGAYMPKWFMSPIHISPAEAVKLHQDVRARKSIAMHFGTFPLADDGQGKAEEDLILALDSLGVPQQDFLIPVEGETMRL